jgi:homoserine dehydrogenase
MAGVPIVRTLHDGLAGNTVHSMRGILNGTTNFILTRMARRSMDFSRAVAEAQKRGLCEADPTLDVDGLDAAHKLSILASLASGRWLPPSSIHTEGIRQVERDDIMFGREEFGCDLKLLAIYKRRGTRAEARVHPTFIALDHPLAAVQEEYNAIHLETDTAGPVMLYGKGAGGLPAASGVISDVITLAKAVAGGSTVPGGPRLEGAQPLPLISMDEIESRFYIRFSVADRPGVLSAIAGALGREGVSIASCHQRGRSDQGPVAVVMTTHPTREGAFRAAIARVDGLKSIVRKPTVAIRIED